MESGLIESRPEIMMGKPVIAGTRITVELVLEKLAAGESIEQLLDAHPRLTREAVYAALGFASRILSGGETSSSRGDRAGRKARLAQECLKLDRDEEQALAEEGMEADAAAWPRY